MRAYRYLTGKDDPAFCHRVTAALSRGWKLHGQPTLTFNAATGTTVCGQVVVKDVPGTDYDPSLDLSEL